MAGSDFLPQVLGERNYDVWSWAELPHDLLFLLMKRIVGLTTFIRFGAVCRWWHWLASTSKPCSYKPVPWLMLSEREGTDVRQFYDLSTNEIYELPLPQTRGRKILGCAHGWVITVGKDGEFHVLNPLTGIQIALPPISTFESPPYLTPQRVRDNFAIKATLSSDPSTGGDVIVMVVNQGYNATCLSFCRPSDGGWMNFRRTRQRELDYVAGKLYSITWSGSIFACEISPEQKMVEIAQLPRPHIYPLSCYTVECGGELLVIVRRRVRRHGMSTFSPRIDESRFIEDSSLPYWTCSFTVYKLNLGDKSLVEIRSIGDYALFVGNNNAICLPATPATKAYNRNSIYFTDDDYDWIYVDATREGGTDMGVFSLEDGSFRPHYTGVSKSTFSLPTWVVPNLN